jgi:surface antigen
VKRIAVPLAAIAVLVPLAPAQSLELDPVRLELVDVPATVPAGSDASVGAFVPRGTRCRLILRDAGTAVWKGPRAKATSSFLQFPWTQEAGATGVWRLRVACRDLSTRWASKWASFNVTSSTGGGEPVPRLSRPASASLTSVPQSYGWAPFGTSLIKGSDWFGGRGVDVRSNGGNGCASGCAVRGSYGTKYQCVELVNRFVRTQGWVSSNIMGNAGQLLDKAPSDAFDKHRVGDGYIPVPGDIIVWTGGSTGYGHVGVVSAVENGRVTFVEQNASKTGTYSLKASKSGVLAAYGSLRHIGYLHAHANV